MPATGSKRCTACSQAFGAAILQAASKYIANLDISALRVSLFGGDVVLRNLELKLDVCKMQFGFQFGLFSSLVFDMLAWLCSTS